MNDQQRLIVFILTAGVILFGFNMFFSPKKDVAQQQQQVFQENDNSRLQSIQTDTQPDTASTTEPVTNISTTTPANQTIKSLPETTYTAENDLVKYSFSDIGGTIVSVVLKEYSDSHKNDEEQLPLELIPNKASYSYMSLYSPTAELNNVQWKYEGTYRGNSDTIVTFSKQIKKGLSVLRKYTIKEGTYLITMDISFINKTSAAAVVKGLQLLWGPNIHFLPADFSKHKSGMYQFNKIAYLGEKKVQKIEINMKAKKDKTTVLPLNPDWVAFKDLYFMSSILAKGTKYKSMTVKETEGGFGYLAMDMNDILIEGNSESTLSLDSYIGPQEYKRLKAIGIEKAVDLGWMRAISVWMFYALDWLFKVTKNYGVAILLLTLLMRGVLWYPSQKSYKHMKETQQKMSIIKPRMETLKKVYKDDSQKLNEETMKLYKEYKINPLGGCLPMLIQIPIFIAFYQTLMNMVELKGAAFMWWMQDLSRPDPFYILPLFMGASMFLQQKMSQAATPAVDANAAQQQKILLYGMPIFLTFMAFKWPSGLLLYWGMSNVLAIAQQFMVNKSK